MSTPESAPFLSVVMPVLNEARYIEAAALSLLMQMPPGHAELLVLDGGSTDGTLAILNRLGMSHPALRLVHNARRIQSAACNLAAEIAAPESQVLIRADAHAHYPPDFLNRVVQALADQQATSVVVPMRTTGRDWMQRAIAAAQNSPVGNGGSAHRRQGRSRFVEHGHHAAFDLAFFRSLGGYDEAFTHNEDAEYDQRALAAGGRIWLCAEAAIGYYPRTTLAALARQYRRHGSGRARNLLKHGIAPKPRQLAPLVVVAAAAVALGTPLAPAFGAPLACYLAACSAWACLAAAKARDPALLAAAPAAAVMHLAWGVGFLREVCSRRQPAGSLRTFAVR